MEAMDTIALNNNAVDLMRQGYLHDVNPDFRLALDKLHRIDEQEDVNLADNFVTPTFLSVRSVPLEHSLSNSSSYQDHHIFSLFDRALVIDGAELVAASSNADKDCSAAVVLFNTGLAFHLQGRRDIRSQQTSFKKALSFYKMAFEILERCSKSEEEEVNQLVHLAVVNNMGHINSHFCEGTEAQNCLHLLQTMLETMKSSGIDILNHEYLPFSMNVLSLRGQAVAAAAAA
jgi:predicted Zn-dependent protease with MMP-like domain